MKRPSRLIAFIMIFMMLLSSDINTSLLFAHGAVDVSVSEQEEQEFEEEDSEAGQAEADSSDGSAGSSVSDGDSSRPEDQGSAGGTDSAGSSAGSSDKDTEKNVSGGKNKYRSIDVVLRSDKYTEKIETGEYAGRIMPTYSFSCASRFISALTGEQTELPSDKDIKKLVKQDIPAAVEIKGKVPENVHAEVSYIELQTEDGGSDKKAADKEDEKNSSAAEKQLFALEIVLVDGNGDVYAPDDDVSLDVTLRSASIGKELSSGSSMIVYAYEEDQERSEKYTKKYKSMLTDSESEGIYAANVLAVKDGGFDDARRLYKVYDSKKKYDGAEDAVRYIEGKKDLAAEGDAVSFTYDEGRLSDLSDDDEHEADGAVRLVVGAQLSSEEAGISDDKNDEEKKDQAENDKDSTDKEETPAKDAESDREEDNAPVIKGQTLTTGDGKKYEVTVSYGKKAGIPEDAELKVTDVSRNFKEYSQYVKQANKVLGEDAGSIDFAHALDIKIVDPKTGEEYEPEARVKVSIRLLKEDVGPQSDVSVVHFKESSEEQTGIPEIRTFGTAKPFTLSGAATSDAEILSSTVGKDGAVKFTTGGFSVYVIISHEGGEILEPRVEFHFLSQEYTEDEDDPGVYSAAPYKFLNKADTQQTSQIVKSGESLELMQNPPNLTIDNVDGTTSKKYFYGWYRVDEQSASSDTVTYKWDEEPEQIHFEKEITIDQDKIVWADDEHTAITSFVWEMNGVEHEVKAADNSDTRVVLDEYGCAHVYLAPIYEDYYFVNFHGGTINSELANSIITRRLVILGSDGTAEIRIGDVKVSSENTQREIFTGWSGQLWSENDGMVTHQEMTTLDEVGEEYNSGPDKDGFYITVDSHDLYPGKLSVDLYPIFTEARWIHYRTGGSGSTYVGDSYVYTTDQPSEVESGTARYYLTDLPISSRTGYRFKGWFANATEVDENGDYIDGDQITDENGRVVSTPFTQMAEDGVTPVYQVKDGKLYAYKDLDPAKGVTLYAHWEEITEATIQVIIWKQKISDDKNAYDYEKTYDFEAAYSVDTTSGLTLADLQANNGLIIGGTDYEAMDYTGFHYRTTEMTTGRVRSDGSTVVNIYYDRDLMTIYFYYNSSNGDPAYTYTATTEDDPEEQYGIVEGKYVELTRKKGSGMKYTFRYSYQQTSSDTITPQYALVSYTGGLKLYEELTRDVNTVTNTRWMFQTGRGRQKTTRYMDQGATDGIFYKWSGGFFGDYVESGYTVNDPPEASDSTTYYCYYNYKYYELTPQSTTTTTYTWKLNGNVFKGTRYLRLSGTDEYTDQLYTVSGYDGETFGVDSRGGYVELNGTSVSAYQWFAPIHVEESYNLDNSNDGTRQDVYGLVDDEYVKLTPQFGNTYTYATANTYTASTAANAVYGLVNGEYVELTKHESYSYNRTGYTYTYTTSNNGTQYGIVNGNIQQVYYVNNRRWRVANDNDAARYYGDRYTRSDSNSNAYNGTLYIVSSGTAGDGDSGFTQTDAVTGDNLYGTATSGNGYNQTRLYFQLAVTDNSTYTYTDNGTERTYTGTRYAQSAGEEWTGDRYTRSGDSAPYTYTAHTGDPAAGEKLYAVDSNAGDNGDTLNGHVELNWSVDVTGYTYTDASGNEQPYTGDRYSYQPAGEVETEYTGTRYTRTAQTGTYNRMVTYTGLYGQTLAQAGYTWPDQIDGTNYIWYSSTNTQTRSRLTFLDAFLFADLGYATDNDTVLKLYGTATTQSGTYIYFYKQDLDGVYPDTGLDNAANAIPTTSGGTFTFTNKYTGFELDTYSTNNGRTWSAASVNGSSQISSTGLHIRFRRLSYDLIFDPNYPTLAGTTIDGTELTLSNYAEYTENNTVTESVPYETALSEYKNQAQPAQGPDNYTFTGWYVDSGCTKKYKFNEDMPAANMRLYAGWTPVQFRIQIDPNGGEFDHINHKWDNESDNLALHGYADSGAGWWWVEGSPLGALTYDASAYDPDTWTPFANFNRKEILAEDGTVERAADRGWASTSRYSTYINAYYMESISEYTAMKNEYVPVSDAFAESYDGTIYYYMNAQFQSDAIDGSGLPSANRSALYMTEDELHEYYLFYKDWIRANLIGGHVKDTTILDEETWRETYVSKQKYRHTIGSEHYTFLGWYRLDANGNPEPMPYNFSDPVTEGFTLKAFWRLDAGYQIRYHADYTTDSGAIVNGDIPYWTDPEVETERYSDDATTHIYRQPTGITVNGQPTEEYIFRGWRLVNLTTNSQGQVVYTPIEDGVYYDPGDDFTVHAAYADRSSTIHMQAVYEEVDSSYRRPHITNLELDANGGFLTMDGENELDANTDLSDTWAGVIGSVAATVDESGVDTEKIQFGDIQSNEEVHLYRYATDLTHVDGDESKEELDPAGKNYFKHPDNYFLLGFDDESNEGDYVATYPADSVIGVQRNEPEDTRTKYAVWEPMVYIKVVNATDVGPVTFGLSSSEGALQVVNARDGLYGRTPMSAEDLSSIKVNDGDYVWLAVPYGVVKEIVDGEATLTKRHITITGTNNLGPGWMLSATSTLQGEKRDTLTGAITGSNSDFTSVKNKKKFGLNEILEVDPDGIVITFTAVQNPHTLVLDDNYPSTGVNTQEVYFDKKENTSSAYGYDVVFGEDQTTYYDLPTTSSRVGYVFLGWDPDPKWMEKHPDYKDTGAKPKYTTGSEAGWKIDDLTDFFKNDTDPSELDSVKTLYAVWDTSADARTVYVYKEVPEPGDQTKSFSFTVALGGTYEYQRRRNYYSYTTEYGNFTTESKVFTLKHGDYLKIVSVQQLGNNATYPSITATVQQFNAEDELQSMETLTWSWNQTIDGYYYASFVFRPNYSVTETDYSAAPNYYDTTLGCTTLANDIYPLKLGDTEAVKDELPIENIEGRVLSWTDTEAGGSVVFTNTRQTADVTVKKELISKAKVAGVFNYTASYELGGETKDLGTFTVTSGTDGKTLEKIPVGSTLTVTETGQNLNDYTTTAKIGDTEAVITENDETSDGVTTYNRSVSYDVEKGDVVIEYTNTMKSYPVTFYKVDQDGNAGVPSYFNLASATGLIGERLYPAQSGEGEFFPGISGLDNELNVGSYTLTETWVGANFLPLESSVTLTLSADDDGKLTSSNTDYLRIVKVDESDPAKGFKVYVYNQRIVTLNIAKVLSDPILSSTRKFDFRVKYKYELLGKTVTYDNYDTSKDNNGLLGIRSGSDAEIKVPVNAELTVTEVLSDTDASTYDTSIVRSYKDGDEIKEDDKVEGTSYTYSDKSGSNYNGLVLAENDGETLTFTNTRKTVKVTVKKLVESDDNYFTFKATLLNGAISIKEYPIDLNGTPDDDTDDRKTNTEGKYVFYLQDDGQKELSIPIGAKLEVQETGASTTEDHEEDVDISEYAASVTAVYDKDKKNYSGGEYDEDNKLYRMDPVPANALTVTFTNGPSGGREVIIRKVSDGYDVLGGAKFTVYKGSSDTPVVIRHEGKDDEELKDLVSGESGIFWIGELGNGTYYIKETSAPNKKNGEETSSYGGNVNKWFCMIVDDTGVYMSAKGYKNDNADAAKESALNDVKAVMNA